ncbi:hypothetical protein K505DRAFT_390797 [Melanomma pulvis-pyrius CBS 109.77]|uniref:Ubiquitin-like protease family profile domain-containing protein n=1 Tax=Melanomma pulvis-pyrius CBS 109.77 TaxID=1314802 RepID=A0A6A6X2T3_9PLEO|nr:hypothetical protein K505DRAFT_390797 [Melanomma pulvis-pyrius CBS 109.77]
MDVVLPTMSLTFHTGVLPSFLNIRLRLSSLSISVCRKMPPKKRQPTKRGPMKRKQQKVHDDQPTKKAKTQKAPPIQKNTIQWVLPMRDPYREAGFVQPDYDTTTAETFAVPLFGHYWDKLSNTQTRRLDNAPIYSPARKIKRGRDTRQSDQAHRLNISSHALYLFFQRIQHNIRESNVDFEDLFEVDDVGDVVENSALLASNSYVGDAYAIDKLNSDVRVTVTLAVPKGKPGISSRKQHFHIIRQVAGHNEPYGYFIHLPIGNEIIVNGQPFTNLGAGDRPEDFWIGPLESFTVIQILGQPIFFWRNLWDLRYETVGRAPTEGDKEIIFRGVEIKREETSLSVRPIRAADRHDEDTHDPNGDGVVGIDSADKVGGTSRSSKETGIGEELGTSTKSTGEKLGAGKRKSGSKDLGHDGTKTGKATRSPKATKSKEDVSDESLFSESTPCQYLRNRLNELGHFIEQNPKIFVHGLDGHIVPLVETVSYAINQLHTLRSGLSISGQSEILSSESLDKSFPIDPVMRSGRPLLLPLRHDGHVVLLIVQLNEVRGATMHILDPSAWGLDRYDRTKVYNTGLKILNRAQWWRAVPSDEAKIWNAEPDAATWIHCAQHVDAEKGQCYTVLNAWALAMGLELEPTFQPTDTFFNEANQLFCIALKSRELDWRLLLAFFRCHGFVTGKILMPPRDRRFTFDSYPDPTTCRAEDKKWDDQNGTLNVNDIAQRITFQLPEGTPHNHRVRSDIWSPRFRRKIVPSLIQDGEFDLKKSDNVLRAIHTKSHPPAEIPTLDAFDLNEFLHEELPKLNSQKKDRVSRDANLKDADRFSLDEGQVLSSINAVSQAISAVQEIDRGFAIMDRDMLRKRGDIRSIRPLAPVLFPWRYDGHTLLVVVQLEYEDVDLEDEDADEVQSTNMKKINVVDSGPWMSSKQKRQQVFDDVKDLIDSIEWDSNGFSFAKSAFWGIAVNQVDLWQSSYFTILNAWSILFNLETNVEFQPSTTFFEDSYNLIDLVLEGLADWRHIWAFLRCHDFVGVENKPSEDRRFAKTIPQTEQKPHFKELRRIEGQHFRRAQRSLESLIDNTYDTFGKGTEHDKKSHWDVLTDHERKFEIPELMKAGQFDPKDKIVALRTKLAALKSIPKRSKIYLPTQFRPCTYFNSRLDELFGEKDFAKSVKSLRKGSITQLSFRDTFLAIASVTLAITSIQRPSFGFSILNPNEVESCLTSSHNDNIQDAIRSGRPMIMPMNYNNHIVLLVLQLGNDRSPSISVVDSGPWTYASKDQNTYTRDDRNAIYQAACNMFRRSNWHQDLNEKESQLPKSALWVPCALQERDWICGHYAVLNAWALALGLEINSNFVPTKEEFLSDLEDLILIACLGRADWLLILSFLCCHNFVTPKIDVVPTRRFANTLRLKDENDLAFHLGRFRRQDVEWRRGRLDNRLPLGEVTRIHHAQGTPHDSLFKLDEGHDKSLSKIVQELKEWGKFNPRRDGKGLKDDHAAALNSQLSPGNNTIDRYQARVLNFDLAEEDVVQNISGFISPLSSPVQRLHQAKIRQDPCKYFRESLKRLTRIMSHFSKGDTVNPPDVGQLFEDNQVMPAIASVVSAISELQPLSQDQHVGGYALATSFRMQQARGEGDFSGSGNVARPRRCWLMPYVVSGPHDWEIHQYRRRKRKVHQAYRQARGHIFLVVVQEEASEFHVYFLDSAPDYYADVRGFLYTKVREVAERMGWTSHRNVTNVTFHDTHHDFPVAHQQTATTCGSHTIINAWILAMGLTPDPNVGENFDDNTLQHLNRLISIACFGILDWMTLAAFLICRELVIETSIDDVPLDRRFLSTRAQIYEDNIATLVDQMQFEDDVLETFSEASLPYDWRTNVDFQRLTNNINDAYQSLEDDDEYDASEDQGFYRRYSVVSLWERLDEEDIALEEHSVEDHNAVDDLPDEDIFMSGSDSSFDFLEDYEG